MIPLRAVAAVPNPKAREGAWAYISSGTWSLMGLELHKALLSQRVLDFNLTNEGGVDGTYRLLKNIAGLWLVQQCKRAFEANGRKAEYERLVRLAKAQAAVHSTPEPATSPLIDAPPPQATRPGYRPKPHTTLPTSTRATAR